MGKTEKKVGRKTEKGGNKQKTDKQQKGYKSKSF